MPCRVDNSHSYMGFPSELGRNIASPDIGKNIHVNTSWNLETRNLHFCAPNMELKTSKSVAPKSYLTNVKKLLLSIGILDGALVKYISTSQEVNIGLIHFYRMYLGLFAYYLRLLYYI